MEDKKTVFKLFSIFQYQQEEEYLSSMHEMGWKLTRIVFPGFYHFERCSPGNTAYRLDYNQEGIKNKAEYVQMFSDCGWDYLFDFAGYSYFFKEGGQNQEKEEIFCDDASRYDMMKRVFKGRIIPLILLFVLGILPQYFLNVQGYGKGIRVQEILSAVLLILAILYLAVFGAMTYHMYQYEKRVLPEEAGVKYKYGTIAIFLLFMVTGIAGLFYFSKRSVYSVLERANGFTIEADQLNKSVVRECNLKRGDCVEVSHDYDGGELYISIAEEGKDPVFYGNSYSGMGDFSVGISKDGCYNIECRGRRAKGIIKFEIKRFP